jgi:vancomycin resistance protein YoaR
MTFRNDTGYPLVIRGINRPGQVRFDIYSVPSGRKVTFSRPRRADPVRARDTIEYTDELGPGARERVEYPADGFNVWVTRTVRDRSGAIVHQETFFSHYSRVDGVTLVGRRPGDPPDGTIVYVGG